MCSAGQRGARARGVRGGQSWQAPGPAPTLTPLKTALWQRWPSATSEHALKPETTTRRLQDSVPGRRQPPCPPCPPGDLLLYVFSCLWAPVCAISSLWKALPILSTSKSIFVLEGSAPRPRTGTPSWALSWFRPAALRGSRLRASRKTGLWQWVGLWPCAEPAALRHHGGEDGERGPGTGPGPWAPLRASRQGFAPSTHGPHCSTFSHDHLYRTSHLVLHLSS